MFMVSCVIRLVMCWCMVKSSFLDMMWVFLGLVCVSCVSCVVSVLFIVLLMWVYWCSFCIVF